MSEGERVRSGTIDPAMFYSGNNPDRKESLAGLFVEVRGQHVFWVGPFKSSDQRRRFVEYFKSDPANKGVTCSTTDALEAGRASVRPEHFQEGKLRKLGLL